MLEFFGKLLIDLKVIGVAIAQNAGGNPNAGGDPNAGGGSGTSIKLTNPLNPCKDLTCIANAIIDALFKVATPIVAIMILIGGFQILTAGGDPEKFKKGRQTILYTVVGYAIIILAKGVVSIVQSLLGA
ncbi:MAG: hypothetical protein HY433_00885 [Candidatus Liptonbacteria bacterium]|nr:hypothetical protein [Candidatus Liptonbacteria bacterium]